jgi:hypothetical protein
VRVFEVDDAPGLLRGAKCKGEREGRDGVHKARIQKAEALPPHSKENQRE